MIPRTPVTALLLGLAASISAAQAETSLIFSAPMAAWEATKTKRFAINPELGRAWVEIDVWYPHSESGESYRVPVPGLSFRAETAEVVYEAEGEAVVCAQVRERGSWIFRHQRIEPTGACELKRQYVQMPVDDGFSVDRVERFEVHFQPRWPTGAEAGLAGDVRG